MMTGVASASGVAAATAAAAARSSGPMHTSPGWAGPPWMAAGRPLPAIHNVASPDKLQAVARGTAYDVGKR